MTPRSSATRLERPLRPSGERGPSRWRTGTYKDLAAESLQRLQAIDLHWHDLRHEYASRLVERGVPLAQVRDLLGHASIVTTERYDNQRLEALQAAVARLEDGHMFNASSDEVSRFFQDRPGEAHGDAAGAAAKKTGNYSGGRT